MAKFVRLNEVTASGTVLWLNLDEVTHVMSDKSLLTIHTTSGAISVRIYSASQADRLMKMLESAE